MTAVFKRELSSYFKSMIGYVYTCIVLIFIGLIFIVTNLLGGYPYFSAALSGSIIIFVFAVPILTMRSIAEERRSKTDQMLLTYPVKVSAVILGKYFAMVAVYAIPLLISGLAPLVISWEGTGSLLIDYSSILAFLCLGCLLVSIGMFISSLTESQVIAAVATMGAFLLIFFWSGLVSSIPKTADASMLGLLIILIGVLAIFYSLTRKRLLTAVISVVSVGGLAAVYIADKSLFVGLLNKILGAFSVTDAIGNFTSYYVFDVKGLLLFLSFSALFVFLTVQSVQRRRWN